MTAVAGPSAEALAAIDRQLEELAMLGTPQFHRSLILEARPGEPDEGVIGAETHETLSMTPRREIRLAVASTPDSSPDTYVEYFTIGPDAAADGRYVVTVPAAHTQHPGRLLEPTPNNLPEGLQAAATRLTDALADWPAGELTAPIDLDQEGFDALWQGVQALFDEYDVPVEYNLVYQGTSDGRSVRVEAVGPLPRVDRSRYADTDVHLRHLRIDVASEFVVTHTVIDGVVARSLFQAEPFGARANTDTAFTDARAARVAAVLARIVEQAHHEALFG